MQPHTVVKGERDLEDKTPTETGGEVDEDRGLQVIPKEQLSKREFVQYIEIKDNTAHTIFWHDKRWSQIKKRYPEIDYQSCKVVYPDNFLPCVSLWKGNKAIRQASNISVKKGPGEGIEKKTAKTSKVIVIKKCLLYFVLE